MGDLCTVGYERRTVDELITTLTRAAVEVLVDVRLTPLSRKPGLSKNRIATRLYAAHRLSASATTRQPARQPGRLSSRRRCRRREVSRCVKNAGRPSGA